MPKDEKKKSEDTIVCPHCHAVLDEFFMLALAMVPAMKACPSCGTYVSAQDFFGQGYAAPAYGKTTRT